jgi:hypothetical protein
MQSLDWGSHSRIEGPAGDGARSTPRQVEK